MLRTLNLLLPALIPSWNFFDVIAPSPRIEYALTPTSDDTPISWQLVRPRPEHVSLLTMLRRMLWNPHWNESLFLMSLSERLVQNPTEHSLEELFTRLRDEVRTDTNADDYLHFRLIFIHREDDALVSEEIYRSPARQIGAA